MHTFTAVIPARSILPPDLALLLAPIRAREPSDPEAYVGHGEGVLLDENERLVAFIVRLSPRLASPGARTLIAASAVRVTDDSVLHLSWTEAQLLAQPRLDDALQMQPPVEGEAAIEIRAMEERDTEIPAAEEGTARETVKEGAQGVAIGAVVGAVAGLAAGGPIALSLAAFFALGGGLVGVIAGATHPTAAETEEQDLEILEPGKVGARVDPLRQLEARLRDPALLEGDLVRMMRFSRASVSVDSPQEQASA